MATTWRIGEPARGRRDRPDAPPRRRARDGLVELYRREGAARAHGAVGAELMAYVGEAPRAG